MTLATKHTDSQTHSADLNNTDSANTVSEPLPAVAHVTIDITTRSPVPQPVSSNPNPVIVSSSAGTAANRSSSESSYPPRTATSGPSLGGAEDPYPHTTEPNNFLRSISRKRSAALMMDLDKPNRPSAHTNVRHSDPEDIEMRHPHGRRAHPSQEDELSTAQGLFNVTLDSPGSQGAAYKRMRSNLGSDGGSSSCKDVEDPDVLSPDSVPALLHQIQKLIDYVASKPKLQNGSASFVRDYLRTMLIQNSVAAEEAIQTAAKYHHADVAAGRKKPNQYFKLIPDDLAKHILSFLDGHNLARAREVCRRWNDFACEEPLWKDLCVKKWRSLETDKELWKLIDKNIDPEGPNRWRKIFPKVNSGLQWNCRLQKTGRFICNLVAHHISGSPLGEAGIPSILVVERRFNILHLETFVRPDASILYFEPESESDRGGFDDFIDYLNKRTRAGLALEGQLRFIFIPPCDYTRNQVEYQGNSLLGVVQNAYPHVPE